jgi:hypothetical protein
VIATLAVLAGVLLPSLAKTGAKSSRIACVSNLKCVGLAYRILGAGSGSSFPSQLLWTNRSLLMPGTDLPTPYLRAASNELSTPKILTCPADDRVFANSWAALASTNISYFLGPEATETFPQMLLAGDRNLASNGVPVGPGLFPVSPSVRLSWTAAMHGNCGNVALGDGSVQQFTTPRLQTHLTAGANTTNWLVIP